MAGCTLLCSLLMFIIVSVFPFLQATAVTWEKGGVPVQLQPVSARCLQAAVFCDLASTAVISHCVWWLHGHSYEGTGETFCCPPAERSFKKHDTRSWKDQYNTGEITGCKSDILLRHQQWCFPTACMGNLNLHIFIILGWCEGLAGLCVMPEFWKKFWGIQAKNHRFSPFNHRGI